MDAVTYVLARTKEGDSVSLQHDVFGNYWAVIKRGWVFKSRHRVDLDREQFFTLSDATRDRSHLARRRA